MKQSVADLTQKYSSIVGEIRGILSSTGDPTQNSLIAPSQTGGLPEEAGKYPPAFVLYSADPVLPLGDGIDAPSHHHGEPPSSLPTMNIDSRHWRQMRIPLRRQIVLLIHRARYVFYG